MKIINICMGAPFTEGYSYQDNLLSQYQKALGHEVTVITSTRCRAENGKTVLTTPERRILSNGVQLVRLKAGGKLRQFLGWYPGVYKLLQELQPDMVYVHGLASMVPTQAIRYKKRANKKVAIVADNHQDAGTTKVNGFPFKQQLWLFRILWKSWIKYVERVYAVTSWRKTFAQKVYGIPESKLDVLVMGIDSQTMPENPDAVRDDLRTKLGVTPDEFLFVTGGKLDGRKKILETMEAFRQCKLSNTKFVIFGSLDEAVKTEVERHVQEDPRFIYVGYIPSVEAKEYFLAADFGVFAGRHSVLWEEAIGCGLPCLFRKYEDVDHVEVDGNCISLRDPDVNAIREVMEMAVNDRAAYTTMKNAAVKASDRFFYWKIAEKSMECAEERGTYGS